MRFPTDARLGPYQLLGLLGAGGMGEVYKARDTRLGRFVAIKILPEQFAADPGRDERFQREARAVAALSHAHICALHDVGEAPSPESQASRRGSMRFLVMEYLEGQTLAERLLRGPLTTAEVMCGAIEIADALDHAQPFDPTSLKLTGDPEAVADRIRIDTLLARGAYSVSNNGTLVYESLARQTTHLTWFDRGGKPLGTVGSSGAFSQPAFSPDEKTIAVVRADPDTQEWDVWLIEPTRAIETRFTTYGKLSTLPVWSPDGSRIAFASSRLAPPNLYLKASGGGDEKLLFQSSFVHHTTDWSRDGRFIVYASQHPHNAGI